MLTINDKYIVICCRLYFIFNTKVYPIQDSRATQGRGLLNEICVMNVRGSENKDDSNLFLTGRGYDCSVHESIHIHKVAVLGQKLSEWNFLFTNEIQEKCG